MKVCSTLSKIWIQESSQPETECRGWNRLWKQWATARVQRVDGLQAALEKATEFVKGVPLDKQIKDREHF